MADDTRQSPSPKDRPSGPANLIPGGTVHTAGGSSATDSQPDLVSAAKTISWSDWSALPTKPCVKDSLLTGMGTGFALGGLRAVARGGVLRSCNWAVGGFCVAATGAYAWCQRQRRTEINGMRQAMEIIDRRAVEKRQREQRLERARELRRQKKEVEDQEIFAKLREEKEAGKSQSQQGKAWWKVW